METLIAFHGDRAVKQKYVARLKKHRELDEIVQGTGFEKNGKIRGCAVGCTLDDYNHPAYETELGIPEWLARLEDTIFEGLPERLAPKFAVDFLTSIRVGVNLESVKWKFCAFILKENIERVLLLKIDDKLKEQVVTAIQGVLTLHENAARTGKWDESAAWSAAESARSAANAASAASAAWSAAWSAARSAESAAWSAASAAWSAARSAANAANAASAASAAWSAAYSKYAKELIRLLKAQKQP